MYIGLITVTFGIVMCIPVCIYLYVYTCMYIPVYTCVYLHVPRCVCNCRGGRISLSWIFHIHTCLLYNTLYQSCAQCLRSGMDPVYLYLPAFTCISLCLPVFTCIYLHLRVYIRLSVYMLAVYLYFFISCFYFTGLRGRSS